MKIKDHNFQGTDLKERVRITQSNGNVVDGILVQNDETSITVRSFDTQGHLIFEKNDPDADISFYEKEKNEEIAYMKSVIASLEERVTQLEKTDTK